MCVTLGNVSVASYRLVLKYRNNMSDSRLSYLEQQRRSTGPARPPPMNRRRGISSPGSAH